MLNKEECQKACLYLLKHCYETDAPALENGEEGKRRCFVMTAQEIFEGLGWLSKKILLRMRTSIRLE